MASALALGDGLRLRSRRVRSGRSHRLSLLWLAIVVVAAAGGAGFVSIAARTLTRPAASVTVDAATLDQQRFASQLRPIHAEIQHGISETGLVVATYQSGGISKAELQRRLAAVLASYRDASTQLDGVDAAGPMQPTVQAYREMLGSLTQLGADLSKAYDDGDEGRVSATLALSLQATAQWHDLTNPESSRP
jgi:hypothetical protein